MKTITSTLYLFLFCLFLNHFRPAIHNNLTQLRQSDSVYVISVLCFQPQIIYFILYNVCIDRSA